MTPEAIFKNDGIYSGQATIENIPCTVGCFKEFRWSWFATQLNVFVIVGHTDEIINKNIIEAFSKGCLKYSLDNNKGWPRGIQSGVSSIAILQGRTISNDALEFCMTVSKKHWSAFEVPVVHDVVQKKHTRYKGTPMWGSLFYGFLFKTADSIAARLN